MIHRTTKYKERPPKSQNLFIKNCVCTLTCLIFSRLQSTLHLMQCTYRGVFSTAQNAFWTHQFWCLLVLLPFFVSPLPHRQNISLWKLFSSRKQTKKSLRYNWVNREGKIWESCCFWSTQRSVGRCAHKPTIMKWANVLKESSKKLTESKCSLSQQCQLAHWYTWVPRTLT